MPLPSFPDISAGGGFSGQSSAYSGGNPYQGSRGALEFNFGGSKFGIGEAALLIAALIGVALVLKR